MRRLQGPSIVAEKRALQKENKEATKLKLTRSRGGKRARAVERARDSKRKELMREIELGALNTKRYRRLWRETLMRAKMPDIGRKVEIAWRTFERALDLKEYSITFLMDALQEADEQCRKSERSQAEAIDRSLKIYEARLRDAGAFFHRSLETAFAERSGELEKIGRQRNEGEALLKKIATLAKRRVEDSSSNSKSAAISKIDALVEDGKNERRVVATQLEKKLETLWDELRGILFDYRKDTEHRRKTYEVLEKKDGKDRRAIARQCLRTAVFFEEVARFREKITSYGNDAAKELRDMTRESNFFHNAYRQANESFFSERKRDKNRATVMSIEYNRSVACLKALTGKAERILTLVQICRKYETQDEKIVPPIASEAAFQILRDTSKGNFLSLDRISQDFEITINFWRRLAAAQLIASELRSERDKLLSRANYLRESVKQRFSNGPCLMLLPDKTEVDTMVERRRLQVSLENHTNSVCASLAANAKDSFLTFDRE